MSAAGAGAGGAEAGASTAAAAAKHTVKAVQLVKLADWMSK